MIILNAVVLLCTLFQQGYMQETRIVYPLVSVPGQYDLPTWPQPTQTMNGNYNPNVRRVKKPCTRRTNSNDDTGPEWIPTHSVQVVAPLEHNNNLVFKSRSLKDKDFKPTVASDHVVELTLVTEKPSKKSDELKKSASPKSHLCVTTTTEDASKVQPDYEKVGLNRRYDVAANHEQSADEPESDESLEVIYDDCVDEIESDRDTRRFLAQQGQTNDKNDKPVLNSNKIGRNKDDILDTQIDETGRLGPTGSMPNEMDGTLMDPTKGRGVSQMTDGNLMILKNTKVCYACSSVSDPTCWNPDRRTTVKYCRAGHDSCVTKTVRNANALIMIRDCASSCDDNDVTGLISHYKSCSICHYDMCNSAYTIKIYNFMLISSFISLIKCSL